MVNSNTQDSYRKVREEIMARHAFFVAGGGWVAF